MNGGNSTGTYVLLLHLPTDKELTIGKLGTFDFPAGWYAYVGSAFGPGGLVGRLKYHLKPVERPHWHIDYFRQVALLQEIWLSPGNERREQAWVDLMLAIPGATVVAEGFGATDSDRESHLIYFDVRPSLEDFAVGVRARFPEAQVLRAYAAEPADTES
jgi:Uri superfamily endonuclease